MVELPPPNARFIRNAKIIKEKDLLEFGELVSYHVPAVSILKLIVAS